MHNIKFFDGTYVQTDLSIKLPGWRYPVAIRNGDLVLDDYHGHWGDINQLNGILDEYASEVVKKEMLNIGASLESQTNLEDGTIQLIYNT